MEGWKKSFYKGTILSGSGIITFLIISLGFTPLTEFDVMARFFPFFFPIILGLKKVSYAWRHRKDEIFYPSGGLFLDKYSLNRLVKASVFGGNGTHEDPYRIINFANLPGKISIRKMEYFILLEELHLGILTLKKCKNVIVSNNAIKIMNLNSCSDLIISNNSINTLRIETCFGNVMQGNEVSKIGLKELESSQASVKLRSYVMDLLMMIVCPIAIIYGSFTFILIGLSFLLIGFVPLLLLLIPLYRSVRRKQRYNRSILERPNIILANYNSMSV